MAHQGGVLGCDDQGVVRRIRPRLQVESPALRDVESLVLERKIRHGDHPVLSMCAANAIITSDPAGNRKLDKKRASGRIDGMTALAMALAAAPAAWTQTVDVATLIG